MTLLIICLVALLASALTFFSGFGLGTLLLPAFALFFPVEQAVAMTAVVHFANGLFKLGLVGRHAERTLVLRFGLPAILAAIVGAWTLGTLAQLPPWLDYELAGRRFTVTPVKLAVGLLLAGFTLWETLPTTRENTFDAKWLPLGGILSGFFGGLSGNQGALRSAFLVRAGLSKEAFIGTGALIACLIDLARLGTYAQQLVAVRHTINYGLLAAGTVAAFTGAWLGRRLLHKLTMQSVQRLVGAMVLVVALGLVSGLL